MRVTRGDNGGFAVIFLYIHSIIQRGTGHTVNRRGKGIVQQPDIKLHAGISVLETKFSLEGIVKIIHDVRKKVKPKAISGANRARKSIFKNTKTCYNDIYEKKHKYRRILQRRRNHGRI